MGDALQGRDNALNLARLLLAVLVIVSHTWPVGGFGQDPQFGDLSLGSWAVGGFFAISGYLITASRASLPLGEFGRRRFLRIFPGLWSCLGVVACVFAPLGALMAGVRFDAGHALLYPLVNASTLLVQRDIGAELHGVPFPDNWNGPLWTLEYEIACYVLVGVAFCLPWVRAATARGAGTLLTGVIVVNVLGASMGLGRGVMLLDFLRLLTFFAAGSFLWSIRHRVRLNAGYVLGAAVAFLMSAATGTTDLFGALPLAYLVLGFGALCPLRWGADRDLSYGVYIYAWPVQQLAALAGAARLGPAGYLMVVLPPVAVLASLSWWLVEKPAQRLGRRHRDNKPTTTPSLTV